MGRADRTGASEKTLSAYHNYKSTGGGDSLVIMFDVYFSSSYSNIETLKVFIHDYITGKDDTVFRIYSNPDIQDTFSIILPNPSKVRSEHREYEVVQPDRGIYFTKSECYEVKEVKDTITLWDTVPGFYVVLSTKNTGYNVLGFYEYNLDIERFKGTSVPSSGYKLLKVLQIGSNYYFINLRDIKISMDTVGIMAPDTNYGDTVLISGRRALWLNFGDISLDSSDYFFGIEPVEFYGDSIKFMIRTTWGQVRGLRWLK